METSALEEWFKTSILPSLTDFVVPLIPWIFFSVIMVLADWRFSMQLWANQKDRKEEDKPKASAFFNRIINSLTYVLLAGCLAGSCTGYSFLSGSVEIIATTGLIVWAAIEFTKCFNKYMQIEGMGIKINLFKLFKKTSVDDVLDKEEEDKDEPKTE
jgi:Na+/H+ antiporter NhaD/arsenite permease-like protein